MIVGPGGTGKSLGVAGFLWLCCDLWPDFSALVVRKTRVSLNESFMKTLEEEVLSPEHESVIGKGREHRTHYKHPNGAEIRLGGMDQGRRLFSTQYHVIFVEEMTELTEDEWQSLNRGLRRPGGPGWHLLLGCANPDAEWHWANRRFPDPAKYGKRRLARYGRERILSFHRDNPMLVGPNSSEIGRKYLERLSHLVGHMRDRLFLGLWRTASGLIYPMWDQFMHLQTGRLYWPRDAFGKPLRGEGATLQLPDLGFEVDLTWFSAAMDFGWTAPGCLQVWGHDAEMRSYRVAEVYQTHHDIDWWGDWAADLWGEFRFRYIVCDSADPEKIKRLNDHLRASGVPSIAKPVEKPARKETMFNAVREQLKRRPTDGFPSAFLIRNATRGGRDESLAVDKKPCSMEEEITGLVVRNPRETERGQVPYEESDPACRDDACDAAGYAMLTAWGKDLSFRPKLVRPVQATWEAVKESAADLARKERYRRKRGL